MQLTKCCKQSNSQIRMPLDWTWSWMRNFKQPTASRNSSVVTRWEWLSLIPCWSHAGNLGGHHTVANRTNPSEVETDCNAVPLDWPSNYSLLRLWHMNKSFHQYAAQLNQQMQHRHMFSHWEINRIRFASRVLFPRSAHYAPEATLMQHVQAREFPSRRLRKRMPDDDQVAFRDKCNGLRLRAEEQEALHPVPSRLAIVGMRPFDRTNTITSNTLHEVWRSDSLPLPFLPLLFLARVSPLLLLI